MSYTNGQDNPQLFFQVKLYSGTGSSLALTFDGSEDMQANLVWLKCRSHSGNHFLYDSVRGANRSLVPNDTDAEDTSGESTNYLTSFDSDGITLGGSYNNTNASGRTYVAWCWKAGGSASSNSNGSITSSVSASTTAGFSIVSYTGTGSNPSTIGHGLGSVPRMIITKRRSGDTASWHSYHASIGNSYDIYLNGANAKASDTSWNSTTPTSSVFTINGANVNISSTPYIAYCFAEKQGFSKFGSFVGNSNTNGPFIYTGFKPSLVIAKVASDINDWFMFDNKRSSFNAVDDSLFPNKSDAESTSHVIDFLSNGFKIRDSDGTVNSTGNTYIYIAFAEAPFVNSKGVPANAR